MSRGRVLIATIVFVLLAYVGSYLILSKPIRCSDQHGGGGISWVEPNYVVVGDSAKDIFRPLELLDRRARPTYWATNHYSYKCNLRDDFAPCFGD